MEANRTSSSGVGKQSLEPQDTRRRFEERNGRAAAHEKALSAVVDFIKYSVVGRKTVVKLNNIATLRLMYVEGLEKSGFPSPEYRSEKLRTRTENHDISLWINKGCIT